jgi:hypothetical protein
MTNGNVYQALVTKLIALIPFEYAILCADQVNGFALLKIISSVLLFYMNNFF